jgi:hypothetical protein
MVQYEQAHYISERRLLPKVTPPEGLPDWLKELWVLDSPYVYLSYPHDVLWWPVMMPSYREIVAAWLVRCGPGLSSSNDPRMETLAALVHSDGPVGAATSVVLASGLGHRRDEQRAAAADAALTLAARGHFPAAAFGEAVVELIRLEFVVLRRIAAALGDLTDAGAHTEVWRTLTVALPHLMPANGERPRAGFGELLGVAARAATLTGARGEIGGLAEMAARKGSSLVLHEARRLYEVLSA